MTRAEMLATLQLDLLEHDSIALMLRRRYAISNKDELVVEALRMALKELESREGVVHSLSET